MDLRLKVFVNLYCLLPLKGCLIKLFAIVCKGDNERNNVWAFQSSHKYKEGSLQCSLNIGRNSESCNQFAVAYVKLVVFEIRSKSKVERWFYLY